MYDNPWVYEDKPFTSEDIGDYVGFVYIITNRLSKRFYIGKKQFLKKVTKPPLKGKKRKRRSCVESDWKQYYGSNDELHKDIESIGANNFSRQIIRLCISKGEMSYYEAKEQFRTDAILNEECYNEWVMVKVSKAHIK